MGWLLGLAAAMMLYVLSIGPVSWAVDRRWIPESWHGVLRTIYAPVTWAYESTPLHGPLEVYLRLWETGA